MGSAIRVGLIGAGWAAGLHAEAFSAVGAQLAGIYSRTRERAELTAERYGVECVTDDLEQLLDLGVDVVSIASPPSAHHEQALAVVAAGRHLLCDKPVAMTAAEAAEMLDAATVAGVRHATGFIWRGDPALGRMRKLISHGAVGTVIDVHSSCALGAPPMPMNWIYDAQSGGGALMQHGSHVIDRIRWLLGCEVTELCGRLCYDLKDAVAGPEFHNTLDVFAWSARHRGEQFSDLPRRPITADVGYDFLAELSTGARARFWEATHLAGPAEDQVTVIGDEATLVWSPAGLVRFRPGKLAEELDASAVSGSGSSTPHEVGMARWQELAGRFLAALDGGPEDYPTLADGWQVARITDALHRSHQNRGWERV